MNEMNKEIGYGEPVDECEGEIIALARRVQKIREMARDLREDLRETNTRLYGERPETQKENGPRACRTGCLGDLQDSVDELESFIANELKDEVARFRTL